MKVSKRHNNKISAELTRLRGKKIKIHVRRVCVDEPTIWNDRYYYLWLSYCQFSYWFTAGGLSKKLGDTPYSVIMYITNAPDDMREGWFFEVDAYGRFVDYNNRSEKAYNIGGALDLPLCDILSVEELSDEEFDKVVEKKEALRQAVELSTKELYANDAYCMLDVVPKYGDEKVDMLVSYEMEMERKGMTDVIATLDERGLTKLYVHNGEDYLNGDGIGVAPHVHIKTLWRDCCISLVKPEYFHHGPYSDCLDEVTKEQFLNFVKKNGVKRLMNAWLRNNRFLPRKEANEIDYSKLETK